MISVFEDLKFRELIYQVTNEKALQRKLEKERIVLYCGFDPTGPSLHVGHLLELITLLRFLNFGHKPIALIGGATALIGDPCGKETERPLLPKEVVEQNKEKIKQQIQKILGEKIKILDNSEWLSKIDLISFLREYGKHFQIAQMISRDIVKQRISTCGISFCEFSYMVLQAIDFLELKKRENCDLQIGGSDQWGNILFGVDLVKKILGKEVFGLTLPLLLTKSGKKFGKTEKGTIFLDQNLTSAYQFYQFWINVDDENAIKFLKYFTFLSKNEIIEIESSFKKFPEKREPQRILSRELTKLLYGEEELKRVEKISQFLFYGDLKKLEERDVKEIFSGVPGGKISRRKRYSLLDILIESGTAKSKSEARRLIKEGGIAINGEKVANEKREFLDSEAISGKYFIIKKGKKHYFLLEII